MNREERRRVGSPKLKQKYVMANLVFGNLYPQLWLENQLKSLCDPTNLPAVKDQYELEYVIFTDDQTLMGISRHPAFIALGQHCEITIVKMNWPPDSDQFMSRYALLVQMLNQVIPVALEKGAWMSAWVADLVFAKHAIPRMLGHLERGADSVLMVPIRSAADSVSPLLQKLQGAPTDLELFELAYRNLHSLWTHSTWGNPYFSKFPYSMLWKSAQGLLAHNFAVTPIIFKPNERMLNVKHGIDSDLPAYLKNPHLCTDWTDAPVAGVEPLSNGHYPPFEPKSASVEGVVQWAMRGNGGRPCIHPSQPANLGHPMFYPSRKHFNDRELEAEAAVQADRISAQITCVAQEMSAAFAEQAASGVEGGGIP